MSPIDIEIRRYVEEVVRRELQAALSTPDAFVGFVKGAVHDPTVFNAVAAQLGSTARIVKEPR